MLRTIVDLALAAGADAAPAPGYFVVLINRLLRIAVTVTLLTAPKKGRPYWKITPKVGCDFIITARLDDSATGILDYLLVPASAVEYGPAYVKQDDQGQCEIRAFKKLSNMFRA